MGDVGVLNDAAFRFSPHDAMYSADYAVAIHICVCPPDTLRYCAKTVKHNSEIFLLTGRSDLLIKLFSNLYYFTV